MEAPIVPKFPQNPTHIIDTFQKHPVSEPVTMHHTHPTLMPPPVISRQVNLVYNSRIQPTFGYPQEDPAGLEQSPDSPGLLHTNTNNFR